MPSFATAVELPGGLWRDGSRVTDTLLRHPTGRDEEWLVWQGDATPLDSASELLARCVVDIGGSEPTRAELESLSLGDREALLWQLRRLLSGDRLDVAVDCNSCGETLDLRVSLSDVIEAPYSDWAPVFEDTVDGTSVTYRVPTGQHLREAVQSSGVLSLVAGCVESIDGDQPDPPAMPRELVDGIGEAMAERDPQAEVRLEAECPNCGSTVTCVLDAAAFAVGELVRGAAHLTREVHLLAWHYHWSEQEILDLPSDRRAEYLALISEAYEGTSP